MRISPIDIQQKQFKTRAFGYAKAGVDQFLEMLADELERLVRKNQDLQEELSRVTASLDEMRDREETLKNTLVTTQKVTEDLKRSARREVDVMMAEAEIKAERLMLNAEERRQQLIEEVQEIKRQKVDFEVSLRGLLEKHIRMLDLNAVAIEQQDADSRMLEEPLPFIKQPDQGEPNETVSEPLPEKPVVEAEYAEPDPDQAGEKTVKSFVEPAAADLTFGFDPNELDDEEDVLK